MIPDDVELDARTAAAIAAGMLAVALADGEAHTAELALIEAFRDAIPDDVDPSGVVIADDAVREVLARSLVGVALADGRITPEERSVIDEICRAHGATEAMVQAAEDALRRALLARFRGVKVFRDDALALAAELGFTAEEAAAILDAPAT